MTVQTRTTALIGEYVRLYCKFIRDGVLTDPASAPSVFIVDNDYYQESSSSSSGSSDEGAIIGGFTAVKENTGIWYVDWLIPDSTTVGKYYDVWKFKWIGSETVERQIFEITVNDKDNLVNSIAPAITYKVDDTVMGMINDLSNNFIYEAMHIPMYWEQGYRTGDNRTFNFAFGNWNQDPRPTVRVNQKIYLSGWNPNYNGNIYFNKNMDPEDMVYAQYNFRYFKYEEIMDFLNMGLYAMNSVPPASQSYSNLNVAPYVWRFGILLYAAIKALQRLVFGLNFQEQALIFAEKPELVQNAINNFKALYTDYNTLWIEVSKNVKTLKLPSISQLVTPEYTLPGGRSRWFRYMYKG